MSKNKTLRQQFIVRMLLVLISIAVLSGAIQFYILYSQVKEDIENEARMIGNSIEQGITETDLASRKIEQQIDYKLEMVSERISDYLPSNVKEITNEDLLNLNERINIAGIDIFSNQEEVITVTKSTEPDEIGFTLKGVSEEGHSALKQMLNNEKPDVEGMTSYLNDNIMVLYTAQAGSREEPEFFKYAYFHKPGTDYIVSAFIEANEVYQFTQQVGPDAWIEKVLSENEYTKEIAILDPRVFAEPSLAEKMYPPLRKVVHGNYDYEGDEQVLINMIENPERVSYIDKLNGEKIYKMFIPYDEGRVIYIALDFDKMSEPLTNHSLILIVSGFISLIILFVLTTHFFSKIYESISKIISQIKALEKGDFKARSLVEDGGELSNLSQSTNKMADTLNHVLGETKVQAIQTEQHAYLLETEANNSVDKVYAMSMEATTTDRETNEEITSILDEFENFLESSKDNKAENVLEQMNRIRALVSSRTNSTTEMTLTLSDLLKSLHNQSASLSEISKKLLQNMEQFELDTKEKM